MISVSQWHNCSVGAVQEKPFSFFCGLCDVTVFWFWLIIVWFLCFLNKRTSGFHSVLFKWRQITTVLCAVRPTPYNNPPHSELSCGFLLGLFWINQSDLLAEETPDQLLLRGTSAANLSSFTFSALTLSGVLRFQCFSIRFYLFELIQAQTIFKLRDQSS